MILPLKDLICEAAGLGGLVDVGEGFGGLGDVREGLGGLGEVRDKLAAEGVESSHRSTLLPTRIHET